MDNFLDFQLVFIILYVILSHMQNGNDVFHVYNIAIEPNVHLHESFCHFDDGGLCPLHAPHHAKDPR
jgi:hypothetical protein